MRPIPRVAGEHVGLVLGSPQKWCYPFPARWPGHARRSRPTTKGCSCSPLDRAWRCRRRRPHRRVAGAGAEAGRRRRDPRGGCDVVPRGDRALRLRRRHAAPRGGGGLPYGRRAAATRPRCSRRGEEPAGRRALALRRRRGAQLHDVGSGRAGGHGDLPDRGRRGPQRARQERRGPASPGRADTMHGAVRALLAGGADPNLANKSGSTPLALATQTTGRGGSGSPEARREQVEIVRLLRER